MKLAVYKSRAYIGFTSNYSLPSSVCHSPIKLARSPSMWLILSERIWSLENYLSVVKV